MFFNNRWEWILGPPPATWNSSQHNTVKGVYTRAGQAIEKLKARYGSRTLDVIQHVSAAGAITTSDGFSSGESDDD